MTHSAALEYAIDWMSRQLDSVERMDPERAIVQRFRSLYSERRRCCAICDLQHWSWISSLRAGGMMAETGIEAFSQRENQYRSLLECTDFALTWVLDHLDDPKFYVCDCADQGGYMEYEVNAFIHATGCSIGMDDSMDALRDQIRQALRQQPPPAQPRDGGREDAG